jgi:type I restriction enzyme M protein
MSSQASSAGGGEAKVRQKLVETGHVDIMIAIRSNFFYTRTVPCELWFLNRSKPEAHRNKVLMLDARNVYRKVTRKICDFSPEQQQNLLAIVWLYRGETEQFLGLVSEYLGQVVDEGQACFEWEDEDGETARPLPDYAETLSAIIEAARNSGVLVLKAGKNTLRFHCFHISVHECHELLVVQGFQLCHLFGRYHTVTLLR